MKLYRSLIMLAFFFIPCFMVSLRADTSKNVSKKLTTLDFTKVDVRELLQFITDAMGYNVIMSESVTGAVSLHFKNVTWEQAFSIALEMAGLVKKQMGNVMLIATPAEFATRQKNISEAALVKTIKIQLHHVDVAQVLASIKNQGDLFSQASQMTGNPQDNSLWIKDSVEHLPVVLDYLHKLDVPEKQLYISAKIVNVDNNKVNELGIKFQDTMKGRATAELHSSFPSLHAGALHLAIATLAQNHLLNLELDALETLGQSKVVADPKIITQNHKTASIEAGEEIPYQEKTSSGATSVAFKKAALSLKVTPTVLPDGRIILDMEISQNKISPITVNGAPGIQTQELTTQVVVRNGQTVILGGIYETVNATQVSKVPVLGDIPVVKYLFRQSDTKCIKKELLILVTPELLNVD